MIRDLTPREILCLECLGDSVKTGRDLRKEMKLQLSLARRVLFIAPAFYAMMAWLEDAGMVEHADEAGGPPRRYWATKAGKESAAIL